MSSIGADLSHCEKAASEECRSSIRTRLWGRTLLLNGGMKTARCSPLGRGGCPVRKNSLDIEACFLLISSDDLSRTLPDSCSQRVVLERRDEAAGLNPAPQRWTEILGARFQCPLSNPRGVVSFRFGRALLVGCSKVSTVLPDLNESKKWVLWPTFYF